ncbi:glycosyltransferase family 2 protein [Desulfolutivibrio sulfoxidireducens]|uniref:glycosyltransferase family 2 protein n=1 Tax=Desulfolutivibrio sulfoxidireducens TaxID=2773299 RepID=UPI00159EA8F0|nr:glycosyltransferase family A protein [Desulfolutivibrio sulfoxidireducens]QLA16548.1 glycosyltransferase [Desulfolutivibrio sulfoxidireducens]QLA19570.1 glycosyltransferase [Desulfolutivibrio sulfoxidireducens]
MVTVTAIIPTYNRAGMVGEAVDSVLSQTFGDFELFVVDDGSTDDTAGVLARFEDPRLAVVRTRNRGVAAARNLGVGMARGRFVAFLDSDDTWLPEKLARQTAYMERTGLAASQTQETWIRRGRRVNPRRAHLKRDGDFFQSALALCLVSPSSAMIRGEFFDRVGGFDEGLPACEDYDLWLRMLLRGPIGLVDEELTVRRGGRPDQLSARFVGLDLFRIRSLAKILGAEKMSPWHRDCMEKELVRKARIYAGGCIKRGRDEEALRVWELVRKSLRGPLEGRL